MTKNCVFCDIIEGRAEASFIHKDEHCVAFLTIRPIHPGQFMVIPRVHIDHFTDLPDDLAAHIMVVGQRFGRKLLTEFNAERVGYVVHGYGVLHAHLNVVPLHHTNDIISDKHVVVTSDATFTVREDNVPAPSRAELDAIAARLRD